MSKGYHEYTKSIFCFQSSAMVYCFVIIFLINAVFKKDVCKDGWLPVIVYIHGRQLSKCFKELTLSLSNSEELFIKYYNKDYLN